MWEKIHMQIWPTPYLIFCLIMLIFLEFFFIPFEVFYHQILAHELIMIRKMINNLTVIKPHSYKILDEGIPDLGLKRFLVVKTVAQ